MLSFYHMSAACLVYSYWDFLSFIIVLLLLSMIYIMNVYICVSEMNKIYVFYLLGGIREEQFS